MANKPITPEEMKAYVDATWEKCQAEVWQNPVRRKSVNPIRVRIMQEAYDLADRGDSEGYNSVKVMCSDVLAMIDKLLDAQQWQALSKEEIVGCAEGLIVDGLEFARAIEAKLKGKNT